MCVSARRDAASAVRSNVHIYIYNAGEIADHVTRQLSNCKGAVLLLRLHGQLVNCAKPQFAGEQRQLGYKLSCRERRSLLQEGGHDTFANSFFVVRQWLIIPTHHSRGKQKKFNLWYYFSLRTCHCFLV